MLAPAVPTAAVPLLSLILLALLQQLLAVPGAAASTTPPVAIRAFLTHATQKIMAHDPLPAASSSPLELVAARNEYEPLLVVLQSSARPIDGATATVPGTTVEFRAARVGYVGVVNVRKSGPAAPDPGPLLGLTHQQLPAGHGLRFCRTRHVS